jgi:hypothetical protein
MLFKQEYGSNKNGDAADNVNLALSDFDNVLWQNQCAISVTT